MIEKGTYADRLRDHAGDAGPTRLLVVDRRPVVREGLEIRPALGRISRWSARRPTSRSGLIGAEVPRSYLRLPRDQRDTDFRKKGETMHEMMDFEILKQRREELTREVRRYRLAKALRASRKRYGSGAASSASWEVKRIAGRLRKRFRS